MTPELVVIGAIVLAFLLGGLVAVIEEAEDILEKFDL